MTFNREPWMRGSRRRWLPLTEKQRKRWLREVDLSMSYRAAHELVLSCGTVTLDPTRGKILLVFNNRLDIWQLPKGRRNLNEELLPAALRETWEETGLHVTPLALRVRTRATVALPPGAQGKPPEITEGQESNEFVGTCFYQDPQSQTPALKIIFFYVATADSEHVRELGTQDDWEKLDAQWHTLEEGMQKMEFEAEREIVRKALTDMKSNGHAIFGVDDIQSLGVRINGAESGGVLGRPGRFFARAWSGLCALFRPKSI